MLPELGIPSVLGETLKELVLWTASIILDLNPLKFIQHSGREALVHDVVGDLAEIQSSAMIDPNCAHITRGGAVVAARPKGSIATRAERVEEVESLIDFCARPQCRGEFRRTIGPGRKQAYCSDFCRRSAQSELRQKRVRLAHFERTVELLRVDIAAFGRTDFDAGEGESQSLDVRRAAEDAVRRADGALAFAKSDEPAVQELRRLYDAVVPLVLPH
jgi:hypothetical protein